MALSETVSEDGTRAFDELTDALGGLHEYPPALLVLLLSVLVVVPPLLTLLLATVAPA